MPDFVRYLEIVRYCQILPDLSENVRYCQICQILSDMSDMPDFVRYVRFCQILSDMSDFVRYCQIVSDPVLGGGLVEDYSEQHPIDTFKPVHIFFA